MQQRVGASVHKQPAAAAGTWCDSVHSKEVQLQQPSCAHLSCWLSWLVLQLVFLSLLLLGM
jgi:hypothetical protein